MPTLMAGWGKSFREMLKSLGAFAGFLTPASSAMVPRVALHELSVTIGIMGIPAFGRAGDITVVFPISAR
jgi:hypothetical protein